MATIDPSIAMGYKPIQIDNPMNQLAAMSQIQNAQNQNALAQYQLSSAQRTDEATNLKNQIYARRYNPETGQVDTKGLYSDLAQNPVTAGLIPDLIAKETKLEHERKQNEHIVSQIKKLDFETGTKIFSEAQNELKQIDPRSPDAPAQFLAYRERLYANPALKDYFANTGITKKATDEQVRQAIKTPQGLSDLIIKAMTSTDQFQKILHDREQLGISKRQADISQGTLDVSRQRLANETNPVLLSNIAEAKAAGEFLGKNKAAAAQALPGALENATQAIRLIDEMVGTAEVKDEKGKIIQAAGKKHPGFSEYVGAAFIPGTRFLEGSDVASFELRQKQIEGKAFLEAFNVLRGGGAITQVEGEKGTLAIMRMNKASSEKEYVDAARELQEVLRTGVNTMRAKAGQPSGGKGGGGVDTSNPLLK
jgi:hypothetical protein